jgi:hypothetical protein
LLFNFLSKDLVDGMGVGEGDFDLDGEERKGSNWSLPRPPMQPIRTLVLIHECKGIDLRSRPVIGVFDRLIRPLKIEGVCGDRSRFFRKTIGVDGPRIDQIEKSIGKKKAELASALLKISAFN